MTDADDVAEWTQYGPFGRLRHSVGNLFDEFGSVDSLLVGTILNAAIAVPGVLAWYAFDGVPAVLGAAWAILHLIFIARGWANA